MLAALVLSGCDHEPLVHNLTEREANRLLTQLHAEGVEATKTVRPDGRYAVEAPPERVRAALRFIEENRLVRDSSAEKLEPAGLGSSKEDRRFRAERALSRSIEATLDSIPDVLESRVHLNIPADDGLFGNGAPRAKATASVLIVASGRADVPLNDIATLVGGAAGIPPSDVAVVFRVVTASHPDEPMVPSVASSPPEVGTDIVARMLAMARGAGWEIALSLVILGVGLIRLGTRRRTKKARRVTPPRPDDGAETPSVSVAPALAPRGGVA